MWPRDLSERLSCIRRETLQHIEQLQAASGAAPSRLRVVGVRYNDVLNVREFPTSSARIVGSIPPDGRGISTTGDRNGSFVWVEYRGMTGWANARFLSLDATPPPAGALSSDTWGQLLGRWARSERTCENASDDKLGITHTEVNFYEMPCSVTSRHASLDQSDSQLVCFDDEQKTRRITARLRLVNSNALGHHQGKPTLNRLPTPGAPAEIRRRASFILWGGVAMSPSPGVGNAASSHFGLPPNRHPLILAGMQCRRWIWILCLLASRLVAGEWKPLFDGKSLAGWEVTPFAGHGDVRS